MDEIAGALETCCPICYGRVEVHDVVDFNKSCEEARGKFLRLSGEAIYYSRCVSCGFCFAPAMHTWSQADYARKVYNDEYIEVDPDYRESRPAANANVIATLFPTFPGSCRHLDYGGGNGTLSQHLSARGFESTSYDPFVNITTDPAALGRFDLITAFEVFEHVPDIRSVLKTLDNLLQPNGIIIFSTLLSDGAIKPNERMTWWYAAPRNGHVSLHSHNSLLLLANRFAYNFASFSPNLHLFARKHLPDWAIHLFCSR